MMSKRRAKLKAVKAMEQAVISLGRALLEQKTRADALETCLQDARRRLDQAIAFASVDRGRGPGGAELVMAFRASEYEIRHQDARARWDMLDRWRDRLWAQLNEKCPPVGELMLRRPAVKEKPLNPNEMSLEQCRDWLAEDDKWEQNEAEPCVSVNVMGVHPATGPFWQKGGRKRWDHPIPPTLDAIAACMPEGWDWTREYVAMDGDPSEIKWLACSSHYASMIGIPDTGDEKLDRARLAVACRRAMKETP